MRRGARTIAQSVYVPVLDLWQRYHTGMLVVLAFAALYRFGDYFAQSLVITFSRAASASTSRRSPRSTRSSASAEPSWRHVRRRAGGAVRDAAHADRIRLLSATTALLYIWLAVAGKSMTVFCIAVACDNTRLRDAGQPPRFAPRCAVMSVPAENESP